MSSQKFAGKVVIVTGSSSGIGQGIALLLGQQGASVTIHGRSVEGLQETERLMIENGVDADRILIVQGEIESPKTAEKLVEETLKKFGKIDVLVNNAGLGTKTGTEQDSEEMLDYIFEVNLKSIIRLNKMVIPHLEKTKGNIVNISSITSLKAFTIDSFYPMSKASLDHYMRHIAPTLGPKGIRMNNLNPGLVQTNFFNRYDGKVSYDEIAERFVTNEVPLGRAGSARDMANAVSYLASDEASYVTGITLAVDGGALLGNPGK